MTRGERRAATAGLAVFVGVLAVIVATTFFFVSFNGGPDGDTTFIHDCRAKGGTVFLSENAGHNYCRLAPGGS